MSIDKAEVAKFAKHAEDWWDTEGPLKTLHDINLLRLKYVQDIVSVSGQRVLDVGCGGGIFAEGLARCGGIVTGIDVEADALETARQHALSSQLKIKYKHTAIESYHAKPFPIITCLEMLEHVSDPNLIIQQASRLLLPEGYLFLSTISRTLSAYARVIVAAEYVLNILPRQTHDFQKFIKPSELSALCRKAGLEVTDISGVAYNPFTRAASISDSVSDNYLLTCRKIS